MQQIGFNLPDSRLERIEGGATVTGATAAHTI